ncbi:MAG: 3-isopropylmalate dehydratase small subunit [Thermoproteales archaeon]|nr:3-isopropylmalate dehydratase small subunit [Thermoproteales archaeon]
MRIWRFGDNINTDYITPGRLNLTDDPKELAKIAFKEYRPEFSEKVKKGDIIVAGKNFGCGSSRETAPVALKAAGIRAVIAKSFARIFFRNAINIGLPVIICKEADIIKEDDIVEIDLKKGIINIVNRNVALQCEKLPEFILKIIEAGGLINYIKIHGKLG